MDRTDETRALRDLLGSRIFYARFTKRDGTERTGTFRLGVRAHLKGGERSYDADARGNLVVFDMTKRAYRTIRLDALQEVHARGTVWTASDIVEE